MKFSVDEEIQLITGNGLWNTNDIEGKVRGIHVSDGPHGVRSQEEGKSNNDSTRATCFPSSATIGCSFDRELITKVTDAIGEEARQEGVSILLGPGVNMKRTPLCGRNFEYFSEDPYLSGTYAVSYIRGLDRHHIGASLKHFAVNSQETSRMTMNAIVDERAFREIYLRAFEIAVKQGNPATVMASYNRINGMHSCYNSHLLIDILRKEWKYQGAVVSDWGACADLGRAVTAGMDLEMPGSRGHHAKQLHKELDEGKISEEDIDRAAGRVHDLVRKYPRITPNPKKKYHPDIAYEASVKSAVLLKNDGILPLSKEQKVIVVGELAEHPRYQGGGSSHIQTPNVSSILDAMEKRNLPFEYIRGYSLDGNTVDKETLNKLQRDDIVVFVGGLTEHEEGEGFDRASFAMNPTILSCLNEVMNHTSNLVYVSFSGSPYALPFFEQLRAMLQMYLGGECVSEACVDLLYGVHNPSGKLAETWPYRNEDAPCFKDGVIEKQNVLYKESLFIGYRYYDTFKVPVQFPFGYGLSYTSFAYTDFRLEKTGDEYIVTGCITNTGNYDGAEITQIFVRNPEGNVLRAKRELRGYAKVSPAVGETKQVVIPLDENSFKIYEDGWKTIGGQYVIEVSSSLGDVKQEIPVRIEGETPMKNDRAVLPEYFEKQVPNITNEQYMQFFGKPLPLVEHTSFDMESSLEMVAPYSWAARAVMYVGEHIVPKVIYRNRSAEDAEIKMMVMGMKEGTLDNTSIMSRGALPYWLAKYIVRQANKNLHKQARK